MIELTTQCPQCHHRFDVTLAQLQQRKGLLRCGHCAHIFDAYECAVASSAATTPDTSTGFVTHLRTHFIGATPLRGGVLLTAPPPQAELSQPVTMTRPLHSTQPIKATEDPIIDAGSYSDIRVYLDQEEPVVSPPVAPASFGPKPTPYYAESGSTWAQPLWLVLLVLLLMLMAAQLIYIYRAQIANSVTFTRPVLEWVCEGVGCEVPYMREIDAIEIRQSALQQQRITDTNENTYAYQLQLQLKNNLAWAQEWPTLVVSFSDAAAAGMATIAIAPEQYLPPLQQNRPFEPGAQQSIQVPVTVESKKINGFSVEKYYP